MQWENWEWDSNEDAARKALLGKISIVSLFQKYSRSVEPCGGGSWTHKCVCPNPEHKGGNERTASCNFNEQTKEFFCFGCGIRGDAFDLMALIEHKKSAALLVDDAVASGEIEVSGLQAAPKSGWPDFIRFNHRLSITFRDYLKSLVAKPGYDEEATWVDHEFKKIDERFAKIDKAQVEAVRKVYDAALFDLERRKSSKGVLCA